MLESDLGLYQACIKVDKAALMELLEADLLKKQIRLERVKVKSKLSIQDFDKFE